jgi:hypothetical protein
MIEVTILNYLNSDNRLSAPAFMEIPKTKPSKFFILEKTGSTLENHIYSSTFTIQSYADTMYNAALMNEEVVDVMLNGLITEGDIAKVDLNTDYNFTDTTTKQYRYQAVFDIVHY